VVTSQEETLMNNVLNFVKVKEL